MIMERDNKIDQIYHLNESIIKTYFNKEEKWLFYYNIIMFNIIFFN